MALELSELTLDVFLQRNRYGIISQYHGSFIQNVCEERDTIVPLNKRFWALLEKYRIVRLFRFFDMDPI